MIACEILFREACYCAALCDPIIDIQFMKKGLHDIGAEKMSGKLQQAIDEVSTDEYDAILLCYGLCNNGISSLHGKLPIVIPRAHDCITLLLGSKERYKEYFDNNPGTYFKSSGWIERDASLDGEEADSSVMNQLGLGKSYEDYVELYGEENADYIAEILGNWEENYTKMTFINTKLGNIDLDRSISKEAAETKQWDFEEVEGDIRLILKLMNGQWDEDEFLVIPGGDKIVPSNDEKIVKHTRLRE